MTNKIRITYRPPKEIHEHLLEESNRKRMAVNSIITDILWNYYNPQPNRKEVAGGGETNNAPSTRGGLRSVEGNG